MQYKTIALELINQHQAELSSSSSLLSRMEDLAVKLRTRHLEIIEELTAQPNSPDQINLKSQALDMAITELIETLR